MAAGQRFRLGLSPCLRFPSSFMTRHDQASVRVVAQVEKKMLPWAFVFDQELYELSRFSQFLRQDDRVVFDDLIAECRRYAPVGEVLPSPVRKMSLLFWMIFAQHRRITELESRLDENIGLPCSGRPECQVLSNESLSGNGEIRTDEQDPTQDCERSHRHHDLRGSHTQPRAHCTASMADVCSAADLCL